MASETGIGYDVAAFACVSIGITCLGIGFLLGFALGVIV